VVGTAHRACTAHALLRCNSSAPTAATLKNHTAATTNPSKLLPHARVCKQCTCSNTMQCMCARHGCAPRHHPRRTCRCPHPPAPHQ
jgi:hypothetical protein